MNAFEAAENVIIKIALLLLNLLNE